MLILLYSYITLTYVWISYLEFISYSNNINNIIKYGFINMNCKIIVLIYFNPIILIENFLIIVN